MHTSTTNETTALATTIATMHIDAPYDRCSNNNNDYHERSCNGTSTNDCYNNNNVFYRRSANDYDDINNQKNIMMMKEQDHDNTIDDEEFRMAQKILQDFHRVRSLSCIPEEVVGCEEEEGLEDDVSMAQQQQHVDTSSSRSTTSCTIQPLLAKCSMSYGCLASLGRQQEQPEDDELIIGNNRATSSFNPSSSMPPLNVESESRTSEDPHDIITNEVSVASSDGPSVWGFYDDASEDEEDDDDIANSGKVNPSTIRRFGATKCRRRALKSYDVMFVPTRSYVNHHDQKIRVHMVPRRTPQYASPPCTLSAMPPAFLSSAVATSKHHSPAYYNKLLDHHRMAATTQQQIMTQTRCLSNSSPLSVLDFTTSAASM